MKKCLILIAFSLFFLSTMASENTWTGPATGNWSDPSNWSNGAPSVTDTIIFNAAAATVNIDVAPNIAGLRIISGSSIKFSSAAVVLITIGNGNASGLQVFYIESESSLTIEGTVATKGVSIQTYGNFTSTTARVDGTFIFGSYTCSWNVNSFPASFCTVDIAGTIIVSALNTGSLINVGLSNGNPGTVSFLSGSLLDWFRSGGSAPNAIFKDGSVISVHGIVGTNMIFNSGAKYNGLLIWDCEQQTASGGNAILLPAANTVMDSVQILSTGSGSLRFSTNPNGYNINSLEVNGGTVELSAPNSNSFATLTDTITNELKITGGTVLGNATYNFDNLGAAYANTLFIKGNFIMTGGTFDFTNRNAGNAPGGAFSINAKGNVLQTGGILKATKGFASQNQLILNGTALQDLSLTNITDTISLVINNASGTNLQSNISLPYFLNLQNGYLQLNQYNVNVLAGKITQVAMLPAPRLVTNGTGELTVSGITSAQIFPVAPFVSGYNGLLISNISATPRTIKAGVKFGINPASSSVDALKVINRTWNISSASAITDNSIGISFIYSDSEKVAGATVVPSSPMVVAHYKTFWNYDPYLLITPQGSNPYTAGAFYPASIDSSYIIGNEGFVTTAYIFTGTGNWDIPANWQNNNVPPNPLPAGREIIINPSSGSCILNISQSISVAAKLTVAQNKNLIIPGNLTVQ
jgi:hypothetical protein